MSAARTFSSPSFLGIGQGLFAAYAFTLGTSMTGMEIFAAAIFLWGIFGILTKRISPSLPTLAVPLLIFVAIVVLGVLWGPAEWKDKLYDLKRLRFFLLYAFLYWGLASLPRHRGWFRSLVWMCVLVGVYGTVQHFVAVDLFRPAGKKVLLYAIQEEKIGPLVVGTLNHHLTFANIFLFFACLFTALGFSSGKRRPLLALGLWIFLLVVWTQSRMAWFAVPICLTLIAWFRSPKLAALVLGSVLLVFAGFYAVDAGFRERLDRTWIKKDQFYSGAPRWKLWDAQKVIISEHPLIGIGWNNNERFAKSYVDKLYPGEENFYGHAHSVPLQLLATTGFLGLCAYLWIWVVCFLGLISRYRKTALPEVKALCLGLGVAFVGFHIQGLTQWNFGDAEVLHNVVFFWALASLLKRQDVTLQGPVA